MAVRLPMSDSSTYIRLAKKIFQPFPVEIGMVNKIMGRGLFATRDIKRGELVLKEEPWYTSILDDQEKVSTMYTAASAQVRKFISHFDFGNSCHENVQKQN